MTYHQYLLDHSVWVDSSKVEALLKELLKLERLEGYRTKDASPDEVLSDLVVDEYGFGVTWSDDGDIDGIELMDSCQQGTQMEFIEALAKHIRPESFITMVDEDQDIWQWYFNFEKVYTRSVTLQGIVTSEEDEDRKKEGLPEKAGYRFCHCRDCLHEIVGIPGQFCWECEEASCPDYQGVEGMSQECKRPDAYGGPDCPTCEQSDEVCYTGADWKCERCKHEEVFKPSKVGRIQVKMYPNGAAVVSTGENSAPWPKEMVKRAQESAQTCCESRKVYYPAGTEHCPCLACNVDKARRDQTYCECGHLKGRHQIPRTLIEDLDGNRRCANCLCKGFRRKQDEQTMDHSA